MAAGQVKRYNRPEFYANPDCPRDLQCVCCQKLQRELDNALVELKAAWEIINRQNAEKVNTLAKQFQQGGSNMAEDNKTAWKKVIHGHRRKQNSEMKTAQSNCITTSNKFAVLDVNEKGKVFPCVSNKTQPRGQADLRPKIVVIGDSHARGISSDLKVNLTKNYDVCGYVNPGSTMSHITQSAKKQIRSLTKNDTVIIFGGTNDVARNQTEIGQKHLQNFVKSTSNTNLIVMSVPIRHDLHIDSCVNKEVLAYNRKLTKRMKPHNHVQILNIDLDRSKFTSHGLHLNGTGKEELARKTIEILDLTKKDIVQAKIMARWKEHNLNSCTEDEQVDKSSEDTSSADANSINHEQHLNHDDQEKTENGMAIAEEEGKTTPVPDKPSRTTDVPTEREEEALKKRQRRPPSKFKDFL